MKNIKDYNLDELQEANKYGRKKIQSRANI